MENVSYAPSDSDRPVLPNELVCEIIDDLADSKEALFNCALASSLMVDRCRMHLFKTIKLTQKSDLMKLFETLNQNNGVSVHVKKLDVERVKHFPVCIIRLLPNLKSLSFTGSQLFSRDHLGKTLDLPRTLPSLLGFGFDILKGTDFDMLRREIDFSHLQTLRIADLTHQYVTMPQSFIDIFVHSLERLVFLPCDTMGGGIYCQAEANLLPLDFTRHEKLKRLDFYAKFQSYDSWHLISDQMVLKLDRILDKMPLASLTHVSMSAYTTANDLVPYNTNTRMYYVKEDEPLPLFAVRAWGKLGERLRKPFDCTPISFNLTVHAPVMQDNSAGFRVDQRTIDVSMVKWATNTFDADVVEAQCSCVLYPDGVYRPPPFFSSAWE